MKKLSTGQDSTLGTYRSWAKLFGKGAEDFIDAKIAETPKGEDEEVLADETQMLILMASMVAEK